MSVQSDSGRADPSVHVIHTYIHTYIHTIHTYIVRELAVLCVKYELASLPLFDISEVDFVLDLLRTW